MPITSILKDVLLSIDIKMKNGLIENIRQKRSLLNIFGIDRYKSTRVGRFNFIHSPEDCVCVQCGLKATNVIEHKFPHEPETAKAHFDLVNIDETGFVRWLNIDHKLPVAWGGGDIGTNMQIMCSVCNQNKGNKIGMDVVYDVIISPTLYITNMKGLSQFAGLMIKKRVSDVDDILMDMAITLLNKQT